MDTPVIDATTGTMYLVAASQSSSGGTPVVYQRIHALSIATGADVVPSRTIDKSFTFPGSGPGGNGANVIFDPGQYKERDALLLENGVVYTSWSSNYDTAPYTGWVIGFKASDLSVASILNIDPAGQPTSSFLDDGSGNSFWNSAAGPAADAAGNIYNISANGPFDPNLNAAGFPANGDYGDSFLKMTPSPGALKVTDYFSPADQQLLADSDIDLGSSGIALADEPGPNGTIEHLAIGSDKQGDVFVVNRDAMGKFNTSGDAVLQELPNELGGGLYGAPTVFGGNVYFGAVGQPIRMFWFVNGLLVPMGQTANAFGYPGATPTVSSDGVADGILWATENTPNAVLHAYLAADPSVELYNSNMAPDGRDWFGAGNTFITPVVADGKVFVATATGVAAFGLRVIPPPIFTQPPRAASNPVAGGSVALSTLTTDASYPESALTYTWLTLESPPGTATPTFSANSTNASRSTVATVSWPGTYIFLVVVTGPSGPGTSCVVLVNFASPAASAAPALSAPSIVAASQPAATVAAATGDVGLPLAPATTTAAVIPTTVSATTPAWSAGPIMLVPQELPDPALPLTARPLGDRRPFARPQPAQSRTAANERRTLGFARRSGSGPVGTGLGFVRRVGTLPQCPT